MQNDKRMKQLKINNKIYNLNKYKSLVHTIGTYKQELYNKEKSPYQ